MRDLLIRRVSPALVLTASLGAAAAPLPAAPPPPSVDLYIAGQTLDNQLVIEHVTAEGNVTKVTEVFRGGKPSAWKWLDAHTLIELFQDDKDETDLAMIVDGQPTPQRAIRVDTATWPPESKDWSQRFALLNGGVWLIREPVPGKAAGKSAGKSAGNAKDRPKPIFRRVDVTPNVVQREAPAPEIATIASERRAWLGRLPSVKPPAGITVTRTKARLGRQTWGAVRCKPGRGAATTFPTPAVHPLLRVSVDAVKFVSPTLPLYVVSGMANALPGGPRFETAAFQGCTPAALHSFAWGGGDVFATITGTLDGAGFSAQDQRKLQLWVSGRAVATLPLLGEPALSSAAPARVP